MTDGSDEESAENVLCAGFQASASSSMRATVRLGFSANHIRERLDNDEHALALVLASTWLEKIVSRSVRRHYGWSLEKFESEDYDKYSLGKLLEECVEYGALKEYEDTLNKMRCGERQIVSLRNELVHEYGYLDDVEEDEDVQQEVEDAIEDAIEFIEAIEL